MPPNAESRALTAYATHPNEKATGVMVRPACCATALCTMSDPSRSKTERVSLGLDHCAARTLETGGHELASAEPLDMWSTGGIFTSHTVTSLPMSRSIVNDCRPILVHIQDGI